MAITLMLAGLGLAAWTQTRGQVSVSETRFRASDGTIMAGLLYRPATATPQTPAPGILAVHGYINTRETQSPFAIEFARRGYVVLALDQRGHGGSGGAATRDGFGGPEGLAYLRGLRFVDPTRIGLEGHSMGGWTVLAAAAALPEGYRSMVLEGSSTGAPFAREGTPDWPRNLAVVYSRYDEFAPLMWSMPRAVDVGTSAKLKALFGTNDTVVPDRVYGSIAAGTARLLHQPIATHPGDHLSRAAVGDAVAWFDRTLGAPRSELAPLDQIWWGKEIGTGLALIGLAILAFALFDLVLALPAFAALRAASTGSIAPRGRAWWTLLLATAFVPAITYYLAPLGLPPPLGPSRLLPQAITDWLTIWALLNAAIGVALGWLLRRSLPSNGLGRPLLPTLLAVIVVGILYAIVAAAALIPLDFRFWVVALRPLAIRLVPAWLVYLLPFAAFLIVACRGLDALLAPVQTKNARRWVAMAAFAGGFLVLTGAQYLFLFATGRLPIAFEALNAIVAIQFVPLLAGLALLAAHARERTGSVLAGALIGTLFVTWYMVAGTATHVAL
ncbi:alpha/beta hydrolase [Sphingomonas oligophenolica]|uniref:Alpha/beta hydrolase n=1 Tax=Sphingomonas oligophenolica TaxID=301154 RepID=A0A502CDH8_9SPHN|nr:alpha/beta hydrolase [Sphingomonas oligophenolica]